MHWNSLTEFLAMGGYAGYVWGSLGTCAGAMLIELLVLRHRRRSFGRSLKDERIADEIDAQGGADSDLDSRLMTRFVP
jgi:heme exporter protein D